MHAKPRRSITTADTVLLLCLLSLYVLEWVGAFPIGFFVGKRSAIPTWQQIPQDLEFPDRWIIGESVGHFLWKHCVENNATPQVCFLPHTCPTCPRYLQPSEERLRSKNFEPRMALRTLSACMDRNSCAGRSGCAGGSGVSCWGSLWISAFGKIVLTFLSVMFAISPPIRKTNSSIYLQRLQPPIQHQGRIFRWCPLPLLSSPAGAQPAAIWQRYFQCASARASRQQDGAVTVAAGCERGVVLVWRLPSQGEPEKAPRDVLPGAVDAASTFVHSNSR